MAQPSSAQDSDPVINVIEQDAPGVSSAATPSGGNGRGDTLDLATIDAVSARRRREFDAARARLRDQAIRDDGWASRQTGERAIADAPARDVDTGRVPLDPPPERVRKRYRRAGSQYFLKEAPNQLAFEDLGPYLVTGHNRPDVVESMVDIVCAKTWRRIRVWGHEAFRREVWLRGTLLGIGVSGYGPTAADRARLANARQARLDNRTEAGPAVGPTRVAGVNGRVDGEGVRHLVAAALVRPVIGEPRSRIQIRLTVTERNVVDQRAAASGLNSNRWIVALVRAHLTREPQLGEQEMHLLSASNQQLAVISRSLGQLARSGGAQLTCQGLADLAGIREQIDAHLRAVARVIRANLDRWSR
jgi:hypothetical protein